MANKKVSKETRVEKKAAEEKKEVIKKVTEKKTQLPRLEEKKVLVMVAVLIVAGALFMFKDKFVVAWVNGMPIMRTVYVKEMEKQAGEQILETLITQSLIVQEAKKKGVEIPKEDIDVEIGKIEEQYAEGPGLDALLAQEGMTRDELRDQIRVQLLVERLVGEPEQVSEEEVSEFLEKNAEVSPKEMSEEELRELAQNQLNSQAAQERIQALLQTLRSEAKIVNW